MDSRCGADSAGARAKVFSSLRNLGFGEDEGQVLRASTMNDRSSHPVAIAS